MAKAKKKAKKKAVKRNTGATGSRKKTTKKKASGNIYELLRQKHESERRGGGGGEDYWSPPAPRRKGDQTRSIVRLLPFVKEDGKEDLFVRSGKWWGLDGGKGNLPAPPNRDDDPILALREFLDEEDWKSLRGKFRAQYLVNIIVVQEENKKIGEWKIGQFTKTVYDQIMEFLVDEDRTVADPLSLSKGCDFKVVRKRTGPRPMDTKYEVTPMKPSKCKTEADPINLFDRLPEVDIEALQEMVPLLEEKYGVEEE